MTRNDLEQYCKDNGIPYRLSGDELRVMDLSQLPDQMRKGFDKRGFFNVTETPAVETVAETSTTDDLPEDLSDLNVVELKDRARELEITGFSSMTKDELVKAIKKANK